MNSFLPIPIQSIILQYTIEDIDKSLCKIDYSKSTYLDTLKWYDNILKIPECIYFNGEFYAKKLLYNFGIIVWIIQRFNLNESRIKRIFYDCCRPDDTSIAKSIVIKFKLSNEEYNYAMSIYKQ